MKIANEKVYKRQRRHRRVRSRVVGTSERPRMCVFRSARHIYAQIIDDTEGRTIAAASSLRARPVSTEKTDEKSPAAGKKMVLAREVGKLIAEAAKQKGISKVSFDRGGYLYHGRVAALAEEARKHGLEF
ncbi:MAG: 50S ribosomal protein L18 [Candidatus Latescibacterota bacterium]|nr:MAG: 50S ribosomal protein L18 [Candidatus Latescibacterota bacterium]